MTGVNRAIALNKTFSNEARSSNRKNCVFISHQKDDTAQCRSLADFIMKAGMDVYFDENDKALCQARLANDSHAVTNCILEGIHSSGHMLCVVSPSTLRSTWVPFEVGFGFDKTELGILTLKGVSREDLPQYSQTARFIADGISGLHTFLNSQPRVIEENVQKVFSTQQSWTKRAIDSNHPLQAVMNLR